MSFKPQPVITEDNLVVSIDTVIYYQVTDAKAATYEIANYIQAIEQLTVTTLRNVIGGMDLETTFTSRETHQQPAARRPRRGDREVGDPRQPGRAEVDRPADLDPGVDGEADARRPREARRDPHRRGRQAAADPHRRGREAGSDPQGRGPAPGRDPPAEGEAKAIDTVFEAIHEGDVDQKLLAYQYLQVLPQIAQGDGNKIWMIPSEIADALKGIGGAFSGLTPNAAPAAPVDHTADKAAARVWRSAASTRRSTPSSPALPGPSRPVRPGGRALCPFTPASGA